MHQELYPLAVIEPLCQGRAKASAPSASPGEGVGGDPAPQSYQREVWHDHSEGLVYVSRETKLSDPRYMKFFTLDGEERQRKVQIIDFCRDRIAQRDLLKVQNGDGSQQLAPAALYESIVGNEAVVESMKSCKVQ